MTKSEIDLFFNKMRACVMVVFMIFYIGYCIRNPNEAFNPPTRQIKPDTVHIHHFHTDTLRIETPSLPSVVEVYKADTLRRHSYQRQTMIAAVKFEGSKFEVERIDPKGIVFVDSYALEDHSLIEINHVGTAQITQDSSAIRRENRRRKLSKITGGLALAGAFLLGVFVAR